MSVYPPPSASFNAVVPSCACTVTSAPRSSSKKYLTFVSISVAVMAQLAGWYVVDW